MNEQKRVIFVYLFSKSDGVYPTIIEGFSSERISSCSVALGATKPNNYPAPIDVDEKFPLVDVDTGPTSTG